MGKHFYCDTWTTTSSRNVKNNFMCHEELMEHLKPKLYSVMIKKKE